MLPSILGVHEHGILLHCNHWLLPAIVYHGAANVHKRLSWWSMTSIFSFFLGVLRLVTCEAVQNKIKEDFLVHFKDKHVGVSGHKVTLSYVPANSTKTTRRQRKLFLVVQTFLQLSFQYLYQLQAQCQIQPSLRSERPPEPTLRVLTILCRQQSPRYLYFHSVAQSTHNSSTKNFHERTRDSTITSSLRLGSLDYCLAQVSLN